MLAFLKKPVMRDHFFAVVAHVDDLDCVVLLGEPVVKLDGLGHPESSPVRASLTFSGNASRGSADTARRSPQLGPEGGSPLARHARAYRGSVREVLEAWVMPRNFNEVQVEASRNVTVRILVRRHGRVRGHVEVNSLGVNWAPQRAHSGALKRVANFLNWDEFESLTLRRK